MSVMFGITSLKETKLWSLIEDSGDPSVAALKANLLLVCDEATQRMKHSVQYFPQYTLHDELHLLRMIELIPLIAGTHLQALNSLELLLTILGVYFHDIGMVPTHTEYKSIMSSPDFNIFTERWRANHPTYLEVSKQYESADCSSVEIERCRRVLSELDQAILTDYLRERHSFASGEYVRSAYGSDKRLEVHGVNLSDLIARICVSHGMPLENINPTTGFHLDEQVGRFQVNLKYIAILLRLADILDFDRERTPDELFQSVHFTSAVSLGEWEKHRSVVGWTIDETLLRFTMYFEHPAYENVARKFLDQVDNELVMCHMACSSFPEKQSRYKLQLPQRVDRSRVGPKNDSYIYFDLEFSLSRNEIVNLLLTHNLYGSPSLCVRELLQNSADALRMRKAQFKLEHIEWTEGKITFEHFLSKDGIEVLKCHDNGIGMDEEIIRNYFTKVGRSYYKSPEFMAKRQSFRSSSADFDPCSQFGIGFMSCFMVGDRIVVETRKDYGMEKGHGTPLVVEINGTGGIISIRKGSPAQPIGTSVYIYGRKKPTFFDIWTDTIKLTTVLRGYALAIEFPVEAKCSIPELAEECQIDPKIVPFPSLLEANRVQNIKVYSVDFSKYSELLSGTLRESFLTDAMGRLCLRSDEGEWTPVDKGPNSRNFAFLKKDGTAIEANTSRDVTVCLDGVLVAGSPGRPGYPAKVSRLLGWRNSGVYTHASCCIDIRGELKPEITPARVPVENRSGDMTPRWSKVVDIVSQAEAEVWSLLANDLLAEKADPEIFWRLAAVYSSNLLSTTLDAIQNTLRFPIVCEDDTLTWNDRRSIGALKIQESDGKWDLVVSDNNRKVGLSTGMTKWVESGSNHTAIEWYIKCLLFVSSSLVVRGGELTLMVDTSIDPASRGTNYLLDFGMFRGCLIGTAYSGEIHEYLSVGLPFKTVNRTHPLAKIAFLGKFVSTKDGIQEYASTMVKGLANGVCTEKSELDCNDRWKKYVGFKYASVDWSRYDSSLKPPYKLQLRNGDVIEIDDKTILSWKDLQIEKESFLEQILIEPES